jgi:hypothetical protein
MCCVGCLPSGYNLISLLLDLRFIVWKGDFERANDGEKSGARVGGAFFVYLADLEAAIAPQTLPLTQSDSTHVSNSFRVTSRTRAGAIQ